ncbi:MAG: DUF3054 domain-containing protein [Leucobacter sp.]
MGDTARSRPRTAIIAFIVDAVLVTAFAALGRGSHARDATLLGLWETAWPFLAGLAIAWLLAVIWRRPLAIVRSGIPAWIGAAGLGMLLRWLTGGGTALPFVIVTVLVVGALLLGWRAIVALIQRLRRSA